MAENEGNFGPLWLHTVDLDDKIKRAEELLSDIENGFRTALYNAVDRAATAGRMEAARLVDDEYTINTVQFRDNTKIIDGVYQNDENGYGVRIEYMGHVLPILSFRHSVQAGGIFAQPREDMMGGDITGRVFLATMYGRYALWERIDSKHVKGIYGPSTAHMMDNPVVSDAMEERQAEVFEERLDHEVNRLLAGLGGRK